MKKSLNVQSTSLTNIRHMNLRSRIVVALAGGSVAAPFLIRSWLGLHSPPAAQAGKLSAPTASQVMNTSTYQVSSAASETLSFDQSASQNMEVSFTSNNTNSSYQDIARQAARQAGINPTYFVRQI